MAKNNQLFVPSILAISLLLLLTSMPKMQVRAQNLCFSQFALASQACSPVGPPIQRKLGVLVHPEGELEEGEEGEEGDEDSSESDDAGGEEDGERRTHRSRRHHSRHRQEHHEGFNPEDTPCCRRLMDIDNACVCQVFAHLPKFVTKPRHIISLSPVEGCDVAFDCDGS